MGGCSWWCMGVRCGWCMRIRCGWVFHGGVWEIDVGECSMVVYGS